MKKITKYQSDDGTVWDTVEEAAKRDSLLAGLKKALSPIGERHPDVDSGIGWWQHRPEDVLRAKQQFLELCQAQGLTYPAFFAPADQALRNDKVGRILSDTGGPLNKAWCRFICIDNSGREHQQQWFVWHGPIASQVCLNP